MLMLPLILTHGNDAAAELLSCLSFADGLPWVSLRNLLFHSTRGTAPKLILKDLFEDSHHPRDIGHQCVPYALYPHSIPYQAISPRCSNPKHWLKLFSLIETSFAYRVLIISLHFSTRNRMILQEHYWPSR